MRIVGLITEYNPFHNGHIYHLQQSLYKTNADYSIAVMSGNYVQRGKPAFVDKWERTRMALKAGVDVVIELPTYYSTASAELFAFGSVKLLNSLGIVESLCFGCETTLFSLLQKLAHILAEEPLEYRESLKKNLNNGVGFATARTDALYEYAVDNNLINTSINAFQRFVSSPNNILSIEYLKNLEKLNSTIKTYTIERKQANYHDTDINNHIASASAIRKGIIDNNSLGSLKHTVPFTTYEILQDTFKKGKGPVIYNNFSQLLNYKIVSNPISYLSSIMEISEGLENRIYKYSLDNFMINDLVNYISTKRYTKARINRALLYTLLNISKEKYFDYINNGGPQYIRILGFKKKNECLLSEIKKHCTLPIVTNVKKSLKSLPPIAKSMLMDEVMFTNIYTLGYPNKVYSKKFMEYTTPIIIEP